MDNQHSHAQAYIEITMTFPLTPDEYNKVSGNTEKYWHKEELIKLMENKNITFVKGKLFPQMQDSYTVIGEENNG